jgi:phenylpyruvate tautomerase PptA (4-oxalocrotonate tautomerase family)
MPVITIRTLPQVQPADITSILKKVCAEAAKAINYDPRHIWATWEFLQPGGYVIGDHPADVQQLHTHSPIVHVLSFEGKKQEDIGQMLIAIAEVLSRELGLPKDNIFVYCTEAHSGKVFDGGEIIYKK